MDLYNLDTIQEVLDYTRWWYDIDSTLVKQHALYFVVPIQ